MVRTTVRRASVSKVSKRRGRESGLPETFGRDRLILRKEGSWRGVKAGELVGEADMRPS